MYFKSYEHFHLLTANGWTGAQQILVHKEGRYAYQWFNHVDMHTNTKIDQNIPCGLRVLTADGQTHSHRLTHTVSIVLTCEYKFPYNTF